jgi:hypothetical protein
VDGVLVLRRRPPAPGPGRSGVEWGVGTRTARRRPLRRLVRVVAGQGTERAARRQRTQVGAGSRHTQPHPRRVEPVRQRLLQSGSRGCRRLPIVDVRSAGGGGRTGGLRRVPTAVRRRPVQPLEGGVVARLGEELQPDGGLPLPLRPEQKEQNDNDNNNNNNNEKIKQR